MLINNVGIANQYPELLVEHTDKVRGSLTNLHRERVSISMLHVKSDAMISAYLMMRELCLEILVSPTFLRPQISFAFLTSAAHLGHDQLQYGLNAVHVSRCA